MKKTLAILLIVFFTISSCKKRETSTMDVVRDCTGTYLRFGEKDYPVCNDEILTDIATWTSVRVRYKKVGDGKCEGKNKNTCYALHPFQVGEWIEVIRIVK